MPPSLQVNAKPSGPAEAALPQATQAQDKGPEGGQTGSWGVERLPRLSCLCREVMASGSQQQLGGPQDCHWTSSLFWQSARPSRAVCSSSCQGLLAGCWALTTPVSSGQTFLPSSAHKEVWWEILRCPAGSISAPSGTVNNVRLRQRVPSKPLN